jgi:hypothetical protein
MTHGPYGDKPEGYIPIDAYSPNRDASSRVIHDMHRDEYPYDADVTPSKMTFGTLMVDELSTSQTGTVRNTGYRPLNIVDITPVGAFIVSHNAPATLEPDETFELNVTFKPKNVGLNTGGVYIDTGDARGKEFIEFIGYGATNSPEPQAETLSILDGVIDESDPDPDPEPQVMAASITPESLDFGDIEVNLVDSEVLAVTLENSGNVSFVIDSVTVTGVFTLVSGGSLVDTTMEPNDTNTIEIGFQPTEVREYNGYIIVYLSREDLPRQVLSIPLTGSGITI